MDTNLVVIDSSGAIQKHLRALKREYTEPCATRVVDLVPAVFDKNANNLAFLSDDTFSTERITEITRKLNAFCHFVLVADQPPADTPTQAHDHLSFCALARISHHSIEQYFVIAQQAKAIRLLRHESHCYREMVDSCPDYVFIRDRNDRLVFTNSALANLHDSTPQDMIGRTYTELTGDIEGGRQASIQDNEIIRTGVPFYQHEDFMNNENGVTQWNRTSKKRIPDSEGKDYFILGVSTDLTEWKKKEVQIQESESRYRRLYRREQVLGNISDTISGTDATEPMLQRVAELIPLLFNTGVGGIKDLESIESISVKTPKGCTPLSAVLRNRTGNQKNHGVYQGLDNSSIATATIHTDHQQIHVLYAIRQAERDAFSEQDAEVLGVIANQCLVSITKISLHNKIQHQAYHDSLTGLPNRFHFEKMLTTQLSDSSSEIAEFSVLFLDLDGFKLINDTYGHLVGDQVLKEVAQRFSKAAGGQALLARMGGDEFSFMLERCNDRQQAENFANTLLDELHQEIIVDSQRFSVRASIGIALYPDDGDDLTDLMRKADSAMYHAKSAGKSQVAFFNNEIEAKEKHRQRLERDLALALESDELELHYQPQINLTTGSVAGVEALLRWEHADLGNVSPLEFVSVAEQSHLIYDLGQWVITTAFRQARRWQDLGYAVNTAINLSPKQCEQSSFSVNFINDLNRFQLDASRIEVEVTESTLMNDLDSVSRHLKALREKGVSVAIDDFGTGYSSLGYLQRLPLDVLKIDRCFVNSMDSDNPEKSLIAVIARMANGLGLTTVVEGVETEEQVKAATALGCDSAQGWYFAKAMPADDLETLLMKTQANAMTDSGKAA